MPQRVPRSCSGSDVTEGELWREKAGSGAALGQLWDFSSVSVRKELLPGVPFGPVEHSFAVF